MVFAYSIDGFSGIITRGDKCYSVSKRGAPHTAKPYAAGGGAAAAPCRPALAGAGRRAAQVGGWFSEVRRLARRRLRKVRKTRRFGGDFEDASIEKAAAAADEGRAKRFSQKIARVPSGGRRILCAQQCGNFCNIVKLVGFHAKIASFGA